MRYIKKEAGRRAHLAPTPEQLIVDGQAGHPLAVAALLGSAQAQQGNQVGGALQAEASWRCCAARGSHAQGGPPVQEQESCWSAYAMWWCRLGW